MSVDATAVAVLSEMDGLSAVKEEQRTTLKAFALHFEIKAVRQMHGKGESV